MARIRIFHLPAYTPRLPLVITAFLIITVLILYGINGREPELISFIGFIGATPADLYIKIIVDVIAITLLITLE